ncbi:hypothetical protein J5Y09_06670 [Roseomonas sp. PWR1]|uniref:Uncharacterized protein n=1 Tax=Roseomonas nitratireducens TaxID=2820810 RepID=A0ABS4ASM0_9PROT|nr:hypothetical protein [Neoroseomonas nitratireducens]MBP0463587.1 hypothetical protein [Neoroseomonas nitratireducens]
MDHVALIADLHGLYRQDDPDAAYEDQCERLFDWLDWLDTQALPEREAALNGLALHLADGFSKGVFDFHFSSGVVNVLWPNVAAAAPPLPEVFYGVFEAFDAGEYDHGDGKDPVETYTRPAIVDLLSKWGAS